MGSGFSSVPFVAVGTGLSTIVGVADAPPVVVMGEVTSLRSASDDVRVSSLLDVLEADLVIVGVSSFVAVVERGRSDVTVASTLSS